MTSVLVLNAGYEPLQRVSVTHAIKMLVREVAVIEEAEPDRTFGHLPMPKVLRLVRYVVMRWRTTRTPAWSRTRLMLRDRGTCGYCGKPANTVDHLLPRSRGGTSDWENTVAACSPCNNRKDDKTPAEAGLRLRTQPRTPTWHELGLLDG